jgi:hypothetical protein
MKQWGSPLPGLLPADTSRGVVAGLGRENQPPGSWREVNAVPGGVGLRPTDCPSAGPVFDLKGADWATLRC